MSTDTEERLNKFLKYGGAGLAALLILGLFAWRLDVAHRRAEAAENQLAQLSQGTSKPKAAPIVRTLKSSAEEDSETRAKLIGRWVHHGVYDGKDSTRTFIFNQNGDGEYLLQYANSPNSSIISESGPWGVRGDIFYIEVKSKDMETYYLRIIRITPEKLVTRNHFGTERVYDRVK